MELHGSDEDEVLASALAAVDEVYAFNESFSSEESASCLENQDESVEQLQKSVTELELQLHDCLVERDMVELGEEVMWSQRGEHDNALRDNAALKESLREQLSVASRVAQVLEESATVLQTASIETQEPRQWVNSSDEDGPHLEAQIRQRLKRTKFATDSLWTCPRPPVDAPFTDHHSHLDESPPRLTICDRHAAHFPCKLSVVANEMWDFLNEHGHPNDANANEQIYRQAKRTVFRPYGEWETREMRLLRRVYQPDGSVAFMWAAVRCCPDDAGDTNNLMRGLELHETGWARTSRTAMSNRKNLVYLEHVTFQEISPRSRGDHSSLARLRQLQTSMQRVADDDTVSKWQMLENRILDASLANDRMGASPPVATAF